MRALFIAAGVTALGAGVAGIFLPVLPTTPLVLLAAACFARGHRPFHEWLLAHQRFGPMIHEWQTHRSIPYRTKITAIVMMSITLGVSVVFFIRPPLLQGMLAVFGIGLATWMYRLPSRDR